MSKKKSPLGDDLERRRMAAVAKFDELLARHADPAGAAVETFTMLLDAIEVRIRRAPRGPEKEGIFEAYKLLLSCLVEGVPQRVAPERNVSGRLQ